MNKFLITLVGYILITGGVVFMYLTFNRINEAQIKPKKVFRTIAVFALCILAIVFGWLLVTLWSKNV